MLHNRYADFFPENELDYLPKKQQRKPIKPLQNGDFLPFFYNIDRPLVVVFYSQHWNQYGERLLQDLLDLHADIRVMGGELLLVSGEAEKQPLPFASIHDQHQHIAAKAGIYSATDPIWDRVAGIEADVPVPAVYVVTPGFKITYSDVDLWFEKTLQRRELLSAVYDASQELLHAIAI